MNYGAIKKCDIANGVGVRTVLFVSGCTHHCKGCFQPETWNFDYGERYTKETEDEIIESLRPDYVDGITLLGGEPFEPENQRELVKLLRRIKKELPQKTVRPPDQGHQGEHHHRGRHGRSPGHQGPCGSDPRPDRRDHQ